MHRITLMAADSRYAAQEDMQAAGIRQDQLPHDFQALAVHQAQTFTALRHGNAQVVVNTAMTGDGKSLAARLPTLLLNDRRSLFMYPTNELVRDQLYSLQKSL